MALKGTFEKNGTTYPDCYAKLLYFHGSAEQLFLLVNFYADEQGRREDYGHPVHSVQFDLIPEEFGVGYITAGYERLKALPDFTGWVDA